MKLWDSDLGIWCLLYTRWISVHGTTPRNADVWTFEVTLGPLTLALSSGPHASVEFWVGEKMHEWRRNKANCACWSCHYHKPLPPEFWVKLKEDIENGTIPTRKLPPRP